MIKQITPLGSSTAHDLSARYMHSPDTRATALNPNELVATKNGIQFDFKQASVTGLTGYSGVLSYRPYASNSDWSGGPAHQIAFNNSNGLYWRVSTGDTTWGDWKQLVTNSGTWDISITGNAATATKAGYIEGTNDAASPGGALLRSGAGRADSSPAGDTWIYWDTLGGTSSYWGIRHNQAANTIGFYGGGNERVVISMGESKVTATTFAGKATSAGTADTAIALTTNAGSSTQPVYFSDGKPVVTSYSLSASVNSGTTNFLTKYTGTNSIGNSTICNIGNISYSTVTPDYTAGGEQYYKAWLTYVCKNYSNADLHIGIANPNSKGPILGNIYNVSDRDSATDLPRYSTFWFNNLSGQLETFGTNNYNYYHHTYLTDKNYTSYTVKKDGTGATGTWGISITGNAATATKATNDSDGNAINTTYLKRSGGQMTGNITGNSTATIGTTAQPFHQLVLGGATTATMTAASTNPRITFQEGTGTQPVHLIYSDYDNYRSPAGLKIIGGDSATPAWLEVEGNVYAAAFKGNADTATALTTNAGSTTQPVYFSSGKPVAATAYSELLTALSWNAGTTAGPELQITVGGTTKKAVIPSASASASGIVTTGAQTIMGQKTFKYTTRIYPQIGATSERSQWYKITFPYHNAETTSAAKWFMNSFDLHFGGGYNSNASGVAHVSFYWTRAANNGAWSAAQVSAIITGIYSNKINLYYRIAEPGVLYVNNASNNYNGIWLDNLYVDDTAPSLDWSTITIATCAAITSSTSPALSDYTVVPTTKLYTENGTTLKTNVNFEGQYIKGTWLYTSAATAKTTTSKIATIESDNFIYYITPQNLRNTMGLGNTTEALPTANGGTGNTSYTANRLIYSESATKLSSAASLYATSTALSINKTSITSGYNFEVVGNTRQQGDLLITPSQDATLKVYDTTNTTYGNETIAIQSCFDNQDPESSAYTSSYEARCNLLLQPRGGQVYISDNITSTGNTNYSLLVNGRTRLDNTTASSTTNETGQLVISNTNGGNVALELWRASNASWQLANESGTLFLRNNYTTAKQSTYTQTSLAMDYNTGNTAITGSLSVGQTTRNTSYKLYINGTSYFNGNTTHNGIVYFANGTTYFINNSGTAHLLEISGRSLGVAQTDGTGKGISLYGGAKGTSVPEYGLAFMTTGNGGKFGDVQSDWATYFTMNAANQRGWIWKQYNQTGTAYMAGALSSRGVASFKGLTGETSYVAFPQGGTYTTSTATITGALKITLPQYKTNTMMSFDVNIYTYDGTNATTTVYHISGYEYGNSGWHNPVCRVYSEGTGNYTDLTVRFGYDGSKACVTIGETNTAWSYPQVAISNIYCGYGNYTPDKWGYGWAVGFVTELPSTISGDRTAVNTQSINITGNADTATLADVANKLGTTTVGSFEQPIYLSNGTATETGVTKLLEGAASIAKNADLNTFATPGNYAQTQTANAQTNLNTPFGAAASSSAVAFRLTVESTIGTKYRRQVYESYNGGLLAERTSTNTGTSWSTWRTKLWKGSDATTAEGSASRPVYINSAGMALAITSVGTAYGGTGNTSFTANRLVYSESDTKLSSATSLYATANSLGVNSTSLSTPTITENLANTVSTITPSFQVNGKSYYSDTLIIAPNKRAIEFRPNNNTYSSYIYYGTSGNEALNFVNRNTVTSFLFWTGNSVNGSSQWYLQEDNTTARTDNPAIQIKKNSLYINKLLPTNSNPEYRLYINGTTYGTDTGTFKTLTISSTGADEHLKFSRAGSWNYITVPFDNASTVLSLNSSTGSANSYYQWNSTNYNPGTQYTKSLGENTLRWRAAYIGAFTIGNGDKDSIESKQISSNNTFYINRPTSSSIIFQHNSVNKIWIDTTNALRPETNNTLSIGTSSYKWKDMYATTFHGALDGNATTATTLKNARNINGTSFNGSADITTANWGTARNIYIADNSNTNTGPAVSVNGSANATLKLPAIIKATLTGAATDAANTQSNYGAKSFIVEGDADTYYPTLITNATSHNAWTLLNISRGYSEQAPDTWNTSTHRGGLTMTILTNGDTAWGGNHQIGITKLNTILDLSQSYCTMVGDIQCTNFGLVIWLRGGTAKYWITSNGGQSVNVVTYYESHTQSSHTVIPITTVNTTRIDSYRWNNLWTVKKASQLATSRTIALTGDVTGSGSFNGASDLSIATSISLPYGTTLPASGTEGNIFLQTSAEYYELPTGGSIGQILAKKTAADRNVQWIDPPMTGINVSSSSSKFYPIGTTSNSNGVINTAAFNSAVYVENNVLFGAAWNDYAEFRKRAKGQLPTPGQCVKEVGDGSLILSTKRLERGSAIVSDTYGFAIGKTDDTTLPIAVTGRVLAFPYESIEEFSKHIGWPVCSGPNGTVSIMTEEEEEKYPSRIIGVISEIPTYKTWGENNIEVNGRVWIRIK